MMRCEQRAGETAREQQQQATANNGSRMNGPVTLVGQRATSKGQSGRPVSAVTAVGGWRWTCEVGLLVLRSRDRERMGVCCE